MRHWRYELRYNEKRKTLAWSVIDTFTAMPIAHFQFPGQAELFMWIYDICHGNKVPKRISAEVEKIKCES